MPLPLRWRRADRITDRLAEIAGRLGQIERTLYAVYHKESDIMSDMSHINQSLSDLTAEVGDIGTKMDALFKAWQNAHNSGDQAAIDAAAAAIDEQVAALKAIGDRDTSTA